MGKFMDITGQQFNHWAVLNRAETTSAGQTRWLCRCACGTERIVSSQSLRTGLSKSCGCINPNKRTEHDKCKVSFCDRLVIHKDGGRNGYCRYHHQQVKDGIDPESAILPSPDWRRKHFFNERYFEHIDTPNKAYILGYFVADGCVENEYIVSWCAHAKDIDTLKWIQKELGATSYPLDPNPKRPAFSLQIASKQTVNDLTALGMHPHKHATVTLPPLSNDLLSSLLLGIFDGDGSIWSNIPKRYTNRIWQIEFAGNIHVLTGIREILSRLAGLPITAKINKRHHFTYSLRYTGNHQLEYFGKWLYSNPPDYFLKRKHDRFQELYARNHHCEA